MEINDIIYQFAIKESIIDYKPLGNGHINSTFLVNTNTNKKYILQKINTVAFKNVDQLMDNFYRVTTFLIAKGLESIEVIKTKDDKLYFLDDKKEAYRLYVFINNVKVYEEINDMNIVENAGKAFGVLHKALSTFDASTLYEVIPNFHNTYQRYLNLLKAIELDKFNRVKNVKDEIKAIKSHEKEYSLIYDGLKNKTIHLGVTHNDPKINNVLFDSKSGDIRAVIDLDTVMSGSYLFDFGDAIRGLFSGENEDSKDLSLLVVRYDRFEAYVKGYLNEMKDVLNDYEKSLLPFSAFLLTMECGMRFLEDYLNGNVYFHVDYEEHNLVRARTQITLAQRIYDSFDKLKNIVDKYI